MGTAISVVALASVIGAIAGALSGWLLLRSSGPVVTAEALAQLARVHADWQNWRIGADGMLEELAGVAETVERRRARLAARESKANKANGATPETPEQLRAALRERARAAGHPI